MARDPREFAVLGAGKLGTGLAAALQHRGYLLRGIWNRSPARGPAVRGLLSAKLESGPLPAVLAEVALIFVAVADSAIGEVADALRSVRLAPGTVIAHTSGCWPAARLGSFSNAYKASFHPMLACTSAEQAAAALFGADFAVEGESQALPALREAAQALGGQAVTLAAADKARYHAATVMASNLVVALLHLAQTELSAAAPTLGPALVRLALGALSETNRLGASQALTGPVVRGDLVTVRAHLEALSGPSRQAYVSLSTVALELAEQRGSLGNDTARAMGQLLRGAT